MKTNFILVLKGVLFLANNTPSQLNSQIFMAQWQLLRVESETSEGPQVSNDEKKHLVMWDFIVKPFPQKRSLLNNE